MKTRPTPPAALADCLIAAQADAERLYGDGPVPVWRPVPAPRRWMAAAAVFVACAAAAVLWPSGQLELTQVASPPELQPAAAAAAAAAAPAPAANAEAFVTPGAVATPPQSAAAIPIVVAALPEDLDAWSLDPAPFAVAGAPAAVGGTLGNNPPEPDESDATPADETPPEQPPAEASEDPAAAE